MKHLILPAFSLLLFCLLSSTISIPMGAGNPSAEHSINQSLTEGRAGFDCTERLAANMKLLLHETPVLGAEVELSLIVVAETDTKNVKIRVILPKGGFSLSRGSLQWNGNLLRNLAVQMNLCIKAEMVGIWRIEGVATNKPPAENKICSTYCYVQVGEKEAHVLAVPPENSAKIDAARLDEGGTPVHMVTLLSGTTIIWGRWYYENQYREWWPVRYARVELWNSNVSGDVLVTTTFVQDNGYYEFPAIESDNGAHAFYVKLFCQSQQLQIVRVYDPDFVIYWSQTDVRNVTEGYFSMGIWVVRGDYRECWKIYDSVVDGYFWLLNKTGWNKSEVYATLWESPKGSYCLGNEIIIYPGDGWLRSVVLHEYGHCINFEARGGSFPPSDRQEDEHYPDTEADWGWAFREGWAEFFECAVDNNPAYVYGTYFGSLETTIAADGPFGHGDYGDWDGENVEGAVAQVFWDIFDGESEYDHPAWDSEGYGDHISYEFDQLWYIFLNYDPNSILEFWNSWKPKDVRIWEVFCHARILEPRNIAVTNVLPLQENVVVGETAQVNVTIKNQGRTIETLNVAVLANSLFIGSLENITLESQKSETFTFNWNTAGIIKGIYRISARAIMFPEDLNTTDNVDAKSTLAILLPGQAGPGDINGDSTVDIFDIVIVAVAFNSKPGDPNWNAVADINNDGLLDIFDIAHVAANFGQVG